MVSHKNVGDQVLVEDELLIAREGKIEIEEDGTEDPVD